VRQVPRQSLPAVVLSFLFLLSVVPTHGQPREAGLGYDADTLAGLEPRGIGPALMGGRIADIAIHPTKSRTWYVAAGSGGVWKTENAGITWKPIFDRQPSYSIGCVRLDPGNPDIVWVGTGENVSGRHVGWGDGIYKSLDGGGTWRRMGLASSEHISEMVIDPRDGNVVYVAAQGPLWASGGERGLYKTTDGGASWNRVLAIDEDTGVTDVKIDPRNPDVLYAAAYQRRRHIWSLLAGGPGSGLYKSTDAGTTWRRLSQGLPTGDMGKIGLAVSPADPDVVYATIEAGEQERGFYRSRDRGESWERRNPYVSDGTGPHYYQEIVASPVDVDRVYQMDVFLHVTSDGGGSFDILGTGREKHSDNHALEIDPADPRHLIAGTDGGLYESFDDGATWRHFPNLPISQFYKLAVDSASPFYNILAGAQDLGTLLGPSRTANVEGVSNRDWFVPIGADGYACAFDPENPNLFYAEWQGGRLYRYDRASDEALDIQPQPASGEPPERWNWDAPILASSHAPGRLYFGSQRLFRSDDRGDSWTPVSPDLTRGRGRYELPLFGRVWSVDALYDNGAMSWYGTLTTLAESPLVPGLLYTGSDDGLIQVSEDGGASWRQAAPPPGVPELAFVNDLHASPHDPDTLFVALDAHKSGDFRPLLFESRDRGRGWRSIAGDLPPGHLVWSVLQDPLSPDLLFAGTEYGLYFTPDRGRHWVKLGGGMPTIALRDLAIQGREGDLVAASFGRGIFILDDYAPLREIAAGALAGEAHLFPVRDAWWYVPSVPMQAPGKPSQGSSDFTAPNPPFGALLTYFLKETPSTARGERRDEEKKLRDGGEDTPFPGWERLAEEDLEAEPRVILTVRDGQGRPVRRLTGPATAGIHRLAWDLRRPSPDPIDLTPPGFQPPWDEPPRGPLVAPGPYRVELALLTGGELRPLGSGQSFEVRPLPGFTLGEPDFAAVAAFQAETGELLRQIRGAGEELGRVRDRLRHLEAALTGTAAADPALFRHLGELRATVAELATRLWGDATRARWNEPTVPAIAGRAGQVAAGHWNTRQAPTATQRRSLEVAREDLVTWKADFGRLLEERLPAFEAELEAAGAVWTPGRRLPGE